MSPIGLKKTLIHPNTLIIYRITAIPAIVILLHFPGRICALTAAILFSAAAVTDYLDGYLARKRGLVTTFGRVMDPVADKLLVSATFIMLTARGWVPAWMVCVIIGREIAVTGLRNIIAESREDVSATWLGKYKTGFQIAAIIPLAIHYPYWGVDMNAIGRFFLWGALVFTVWSGFDYFIRFRKLLRLNG
ncbi:MAG: CDP-diacylglycerol--glycerol-3-phosphate 3-phosphatidyltransferase [Thermodesulfobacteriota bacterium]